MKIQLTSKQTVDDKRLRQDITTIQDAINGIQSIMEIDAHTSNPSFTSDQDLAEKVFIWYNSTDGKLRFRYKGVNTNLH